MTKRQVQERALALAHERWSLLPEPERVLTRWALDYGLHDRDADEPDPEVFDRLYEQALAEVRAQA